MSSPRRSNYTSSPRTSTYTSSSPRTSTYSTSSYSPSTRTSTYSSSPRTSSYTSSPRTSTYSTSTYTASPRTSYASPRTSTYSSPRIHDISNVVSSPSCDTSPYTKLKQVIKKNHDLKVSARLSMQVTSLYHYFNFTAQYQMWFLIHSYAQFFTSIKIHYTG